MFLNFFVSWGWGLQAREHSALARELLPFCPSISSCREEKLEVLLCLLNVHLTQGGASLLTAKYPSHVMVYNNVCELDRSISSNNQAETSLDSSPLLRRPNPLFWRQNKFLRSFITSVASTRKKRWRLSWTSPVVYSGSVGGQNTSLGICLICFSQTLLFQIVFHI